MSVDAENYNKPPVRWDILTRRYIALQNETFLSQAIEIAKETTDKEIIQILESRLNRKFARFIDSIEDVFLNLVIQGRLEEGLTLDLLGLTIKSQLLNHLEGLSPNDLKERFMTGLEACHEAILDAESLPDKSCEAFFKGIIGNGLCEIGAFKKSEEYYSEALKIWRDLTEEDSEIYLPGLARILNNTGNLYSKSASSRAERFYEESLDIYRELASKNSQIYLPETARTFNNLAALHDGNMKSAEAEKNYVAALEIWRELAKSDPHEYLSDLALVLNNFGNYQALNKEYSAAKNLLTESLEIYQGLAKDELLIYSPDDPPIYLPLVALTFNSLGVLQQELYKFKEAEKFLTEGLKIRRYLVEVNSQTYSTDLAHSLNSFGNFYRSINEFTKAENFLTESLELRRKLAKDGTPHKLSQLAGTLNNLAVLQSEINKFKKAEKSYKEAVKIWRKLELNSHKYLANLAETINNLAVLQNRLNKFKESKESFEEALKIQRKLAKDNPRTFLSDVAGTLNNFGNFYASNNEFVLSKKVYSEALKIYRNLAKNDPGIYLHNIAQTLDNLATLQKNVNKFEEAEKFYVEALDIRRDIAKNGSQHNTRYVAETLNNLAALQNYINQFTKAEEFFTEALEIWRELVKFYPRKYLSDLGRTLNNLAVLQQELYEFEKAEKFYEEALKIYRRLAKDNPPVYLPQVATILNNRAVLKKNTDKFAAEKFFTEALEIQNKLAEDNSKIYLPAKARLLSNLAALKYKAKKFKEAVDCGTKAEEIYRNLAKDNPSVYLPDWAKMLNNLAALQKDSREFVEAEKSFHEALGIIRKLAKKSPQIYLPSLIGTLHNLGGLQYQLDRDADACKTYLEALRESKKLASENTLNYLPEVAHVHSNFGYVLIAEKNYKAALKHFTKAIEIAQQLRKRLLGINSRKQVFQKYNSIYLGLTFCHFMLRNFEKAIEIAEQGKSRSLNDHLSLQALFPKIPPNTAPKRREKLTGDFKKFIQTIRDAEVTESIISESFQKSLQLISDDPKKNPDREDKENKIKRAEKKLFKLWNDRNVLLDKIRKIDPHYPPEIEDLNFEQIADVSQESKHAIVMFRVFEIISFIFIVFPDRSYKIIPVRDFTSKDLNKISFEQIKNNRFKAGIRERYVTRDSAIGIKKDNFALILSLLKEVNEKLIKPIKCKLRNKGVKDVLFLPNGMLAILPLHACFDEDEGKYLLEEFNIKFTTSVSVFKRNLELKQKRRLLNKLMFVTNPRCDLENAEAEVKGICDIYGLNYESYEHNLIRERATYKGVQNKLSGEFDIFHFACHGDYEWEEPFSSPLKLANGESITLKEIMQINLSHARLVVLSACKSGLVDYRDLSDEHYGFPFGFILAGVPSVWGTLWSVDDKATSILLTKAYQNLKNGTEPSEALRQAQIEVFKDSAYKSPYYWAGFQHFGI